VLKVNGTVQSCGYNAYGQTGRGDELFKYTFGPVLRAALTNLTNVKEIHGNNGGASANGATYFLCNDGSLWSVGYNGVGGLGLGNTVDRAFATQITSLGTSVQKFRTSNVPGGHASCYAWVGNNIYAWGWNNNGQLGDSTYTNKFSPTLVTFPGIVSGARTNVVNALNFAFSNIKDLIAKPYGFAILTTDGRVYACGYNGWGQTGQGSDFVNPNRLLYVRTPNDDAASIALYGHSIYLTLCIITREGRVYTCGYNGHGEVGNGDTSNIYYSPVEAYRF
jgi:alpha-tubulin suppressor-like RCC1 family protein